MIPSTFITLQCLHLTVHIIRLVVVQKLSIRTVTYGGKYNCLHEHVLASAVGQIYPLC